MMDKSNFPGAQQPGSTPLPVSENSSRTASQISEKGLEVLGRGSKRLLQAIEDLRVLGVEELGLSLPKICVVGDQSTGKSSLIEGISEIRVPRKAGVCTRCPIEINITEGAHPWKCDVYLHKKYIYEGLKFQNLGASRNRPLGPWIEQHAEDQHFATILTKDEVGQVLHWAQLATLNPSTAPELYKPGSNHHTNESLQVKFSPNVVRVKISGPGLPNLAFYDLPGVINVAESDKEGYLIKLVRNLVTKYLRDDNCITILATPMTADAAVSSAGEIIRDVHAQSRTLGVLTKPDRLPPGEPLDQWISILSDRLYPLGYGYHVIKNNPDVSVDHATAREEEKEFFATEPAFNSDLKDYKSKFGTEQLQNKLSKLLTDQIQTKLPRITAKILEKAATVDEELRTLPEPPAGNLPHLIYSRIIDFSRSIEEHIEGGSPDKPFQSMWHDLIQDFRKLLADSRPVLKLPATMGAVANNLCPQDDVPRESSPGPAAISIESDTDDNGAENICRPKPLPTKKRQIRPSPNTQTPKRTKLNDIPKHMNGAKAAPGPAKKFSLEDIHGMISQGHRGLPGQSDPRVCERMISFSMHHWETLMNQFLKDTKSMCERLVSNRVAESFSHWKSTPLYSKILHICETFLLRILSHQQVAATRSHAMELHKAITFDVEGMKQAREKAFASLYAARLNNRIIIYLNEEEALIGKRTTDQARKDKIAKISIEKLGPDPYDQEIHAMAWVRAYYELAFSRFVDVLGQGIQFELFGSMRKDLGDELIKGLEIQHSDADKRCALLLAVDPEIEERRLRLRQDQEALLQARTRLESLSQDTLDQGRDE